MRHWCSGNTLAFQAGITGSNPVCRSSFNCYCNRFYNHKIRAMQQIVNTLLGFTKRKYYINYDNIVVPVELRGDDEKFLNGIDL